MLVAVGMLFTASMTHAAEAVDIDTGEGAPGESLSVHLSLRPPLQNAENLSIGVVAESYDEDIARTTQGDAASASELNRKGLGLGKVVKFGRLPVKIQLAVQYMPVHPDISGQEWNVQPEVTPVIPKLVKGVLFQ
jgi:hypothetical protein